MNLLIVEDEWAIARMLERKLRSVGFEQVMKVGSVDKALALLEQQVFDCAILDANLDGLNAEPVAVALLQRGVPFLVISGHAEQTRPGALGQAPLLAKPFELSDFAALVNALLNRRT